MAQDFRFWDGKTSIDPFPSCPPTEGVIYNFGGLDSGDSNWLNPPAFNLDLNKTQKSLLASGKAGIVVHACLMYGTVAGPAWGITEYCTIAYRLDRIKTAPCSSNSLILK